MVFVARTWLGSIIFLSLICSVPISREAREHKRIVVRSGGANCPEAQFSRIQAARQSKGGS